MENQYPIFQRAIDAWGVEFQELQCIEECAELIVALRHKNRAARKSYYSSDFAAVVTEMADVAIMLEQMKLIYGEDNFNAEYERKVKRLKDKLDKNMTSNNIPEEFPKKQKEMAICPHIGESGGCDDCKMNLDPMSCEEELRDYEANTS